MPEAPVDENGTVLYFEDSGAPSGSSTYLTVVLLHGLLFHGAIFQNLVPHAASNNLRLVRVNMRDYPGSSGFSQEELDALTSGNLEKQAEAMKVQGQQIAAFLRHFAVTYDIPPTAQVDGKAVGGMALLTWSMSNNLAISLLAHAGSLAPETHDALAKYLRTVILFDPVAGSTCGVGLPQGAYHPFRDTSLSMEERVALAEVWLSYYFTPVHDLADATPERLNARTPLHEGGPAGQADPAKTPTLLRMTSEQREAVKDSGALLRSSLTILRVTPAVFRANFERALFDTRGVLPGLRVIYAWCDETMSDALYAGRFTTDRLREAQSEGTQIREIEFHKLEGCNHFPHWDHPEKVINLISSRA
ncbi:hypothetical protein PsYK624_094600 [Phanerochaete sordida]|uniref:AB hydrolase-1 domain-containing protein n=1 Tax=Phanerochaete sordida TaxID=48140 RepID=A0A9P3GEH0_9APHY|nr:hypothetical protein PsYK624_094600 [Phanerochaete sordida]